MVHFKLADELFIFSKAGTLILGEYYYISFREVIGKIEMV